jgi:hypothetical protein
MKKKDLLCVQTYASLSNTRNLLLEIILPLMRTIRIDLLINTRVSVVRTSIRVILFMNRITLIIERSVLLFMYKTVLIVLIVVTKL